MNYAKKIMLMSNEVKDDTAQTTIHRLSPRKDFKTALVRDVKFGLSQKPPLIPPKYRYDAEGSRICELIADTPEYYLTRIETEILREHAMDIMRLVAPHELVELGSGYSTKTRILIEAMRSTGCYRYAPLDISESALREAADALTADYTWLKVKGQIGDFDTDLPKLRKNGKRLIALLGTSIGNYNLASKTERERFLSQIGAIMTQGDALLLGIDLVKHVPDILKAYDDSKGFNKRFKLRTLDIINRELNANFTVADFEYVCRWDDERSAVLSSLQAQCSMKISISSIPLQMDFAKGDEIFVGISCKFTRKQITQELAAVDLDVGAWYTDRDERYAVLVAFPKPRNLKA